MMQAQGREYGRHQRRPSHDGRVLPAVDLKVIRQYGIGKRLRLLESNTDTFAGNGIDRR
jgi:hypothetical protein